ncbi:MAG: hypothetical protein AAGN15_23865 [Cyanobacteria bacterium J06581_3]
MNDFLKPDLDAIARNLIYLNLGHLTLEEAINFEHELSVIASLNEAIEITTTALHSPQPDLWQKVFPLLSDAAALLSSHIAPLIALNAERAEDFQLCEQAEEKAVAFSCH